MPNNFEVGDVVRCIEGTVTRLGTGTTYVVISCTDYLVYLVDNIGYEGGWSVGRFELECSLHPKTSELTGMTQFYKDREKSYG
jgi:hypothetical protein